MIGPIQLKVCGITSRRDAAAALASGADYLGFNLYAGSPRHVPLAALEDLLTSAPEGSRVAVLVEPSRSELEQAASAAFDFFQIHFRHDTALGRVAAWSEALGPHRVWLAPKLPPVAEVSPEWIPLAGHFLLDTFSPEIFGGTGKTGDWAKFSRTQAAYPGKRWVLSGGLTPSNVAEAIGRSGARIVDVNSGVESAPGIKDPAKLAALSTVLRAA